MLQFYKVRHIIYDKNEKRELCSWERWNDICSDKKLSYESIDLTWDNICEIGICSSLNPEIIKRRKGRIFKCHQSLNYEYFKFKEWKRPELNLEYRTEYIPVIKSIEEILDYADGEMAIQYLVERGISIISKTGGIGFGIR